MKPAAAVERHDALGVAEAGSRKKWHVLRQPGTQSAATVEEAFSIRGAPYTRATMISSSPGLGRDEIIRELCSSARERRASVERSHLFF